MGIQTIVVGTYNYGKHPGMPAFDYRPDYVPREPWASKGIYAVEMDSNGILSNPTLIAEGLNPSYVCAHPSGNYLYAINELENFEGKSTGAVTAYRIVKENSNKISLQILNQLPSNGITTCHVSTDKSGKHVFVSNYNGPTVSVYSVQNNGSLALSSVTTFEGKGPNLGRQSHSHPHSAVLDSGNEFLFVTDLGADSILVFRVSPEGLLHPHSVVKTKPGTGPRQLTWHPEGKLAYVINELSSTINVYSYDGKGNLTEIEEFDISPADYTGTKWSSEIRVHPNGKFLFATNRILDSFVVCTIDSNGKLKIINRIPTNGKTPRNFTINSAGTFLVVANQHSDNVSSFKIDTETGNLTLVASMEIPSAACITYL